MRRFFLIISFIFLIKTVVSPVEAFTPTPTTTPLVTPTLTATITPTPTFSAITATPTAASLPQTSIYTPTLILIIFGVLIFTGGFFWLLRPIKTR